MESNTLNFGIIGNCQSSALINENSSIDWCCLPQFDSASVFAKILDEQKGGSFKIECDETYNTYQNYGLPPKPISYVGKKTLALTRSSQIEIKNYKRKKRK